MKKLGAILFGIVFILGLSIVTAPAQQPETVNPNGIDSFWGDDWWPDPSVESLNDWGDDPTDSVSSIIEPSGGLTVDLEDPTGGPYTAIKVKLMTYSFGDTDVVVTLKGVQIPGEWSQRMLDGGFTEYSSDVPEWTGLNMSAAELADLQVEMEMYPMDMLQIAAIQVELVSEGTDPEPEVISVRMDYKPYNCLNPLKYYRYHKKHGKVRVVIHGSADFDVHEIDRESLFLEGVAPKFDRIRRVYSCADRAKDQYEDLVLWFRTPELIEAVENKSLEQEGRELKNCERLFLNLTGNLKDGEATPIEGQDMVVVVGKRHKHKK